MIRVNILLPKKSWWSVLLSRRNKPKSWWSSGSSGTMTHAPLEGGNGDMRFVGENGQNSITEYTHVYTL